MREFYKVGFEEIDERNFFIYALTLKEEGRDKTYGVGVEAYAEPAIQDIFKVKGLQQEINDKLQVAKKFRNTKYYQITLRSNKLFLIFLPQAEEQMSDELLKATCDLLDLLSKNF